MKKIIFLLFLCLFAFVGVVIERCEAGTPSLKYLTHAFIKIKTSEGKIIYIDPYSATDPDSADVVLITHEHSDHNDLTRVIQKPTCQVIRSANALIGGVYKTFTIGNISVTAVPAYDQYHSKSNCVGYIVEFDSIKIYHACDTGLIPEMADLASQNITYALLPMYIGPTDLTQAAANIQAKYLIPIHTNWPDITYNKALVGQFKSPYKLIILLGQTIELRKNSSEYIGKTLRVPQEYSTIQSAIDAAQNSDTVLVSEGIYYENVRYNGKNIIVTSNYLTTKNWQTVLNTIIDGSTAVDKNNASTVNFLIGEDSTAVLDGFTIRGGTGTKYMFPNGTGTNPWQEGAGIILHYSSAIIRNNYITNNTMTPQSGVTNGGGGGIASMYGNPKIYNNVVVSNTAGYAGGIVLNWSGGTIKNNIVYHNTGGIKGGTGGIMSWYVPPNSAFIENNIVIGNVSPTTAGGIDIMVTDGSTIPTVKNNIVWGNRQTSGGQIRNPQYSTYNNVEDYSSGTNISIYPQLQDSLFLLLDTSPCIDAGDPVTTYNDIEDPSISGMALSPSKGTLRNDIGAYGGPFAKILPSINVYDLFVPNTSLALQCSVGQQAYSHFPIRNLSSHKVTIDSITQSNSLLFSLNKDFSRQVFDLFVLDTIKVQFQPTANGVFYDTMRVFHNAVGINNPIILAITGTAVGGPTDVPQEHLINQNFQLFQNYPNPFNPTTEIRFEIGVGGFVTLKIFDVLGRKVATLVNEIKRAGDHSIQWNAGGIPSGVYFYRIETHQQSDGQTSSFTETKRLILLK